MFNINAFKKMGKFALTNAFEVTIPDAPESKFSVLCNSFKFLPDNQIALTLYVDDDFEVFDALKKGHTDKMILTVFSKNGEKTVTTEFSYLSIVDFEFSPMSWAETNNVLQVTFTFSYERKHLYD